MAGPQLACAACSPSATPTQIVMEMGEREILPVVQRTPVDRRGQRHRPDARDAPLPRATSPTRGSRASTTSRPSGSFDGRFRKELEASDLGLRARGGHDRHRARARAVHDRLRRSRRRRRRRWRRRAPTPSIAHMGLTVGGSIGMSADDAFTLDASCERVQAIGEAALAERPDVIVLCHGGPIATPEDAAYVMARSNAVGFVGASSMERLPVEQALSTTTEHFKSIPDRHAICSGHDDRAHRRARQQGRRRRVPGVAAALARARRDDRRRRRARRARARARHRRVGGSPPPAALEHAELVGARRPLGRDRRDGRRRDRRARRVCTRGDV